MAAPVEAKVTASTGAAAASGLILWLLSAYVFRGAVPDVIVSWVYVLVPGALAFTAGYRARHTPRTDTPPVITVNAAAGSGQAGRQIAAAVKAYGQQRAPGPARRYDPAQAPVAPVVATSSLQPPAAAE